MGFLYVNSKGKKWKDHSYSAGNTYDQSPRKYFLQKVLGWKEKDNKARFCLGHAFEDSIQFFHENNGSLKGAQQKFLEGWLPFQNADLQYTKVEKNWHQCLNIANDWLFLYSIRQPSLPIPIGGQALFQREAEKEVFPNDPIYGEIIDRGRLDIVAYVDPHHPLLPKLEWKEEYGAFRPLIVDIKTAGQDFPQTYGLAAFDLQLRRYSWQSGIRDVALLTFVKKSPALQKGYSVTLLEDAGNFRAGQEAVIALMDKSDCWLVANDFLVEEMERAQGKKKNKNGVEATDQTNEAKARRDKWLLEFAVLVPSDIVTKQRLQFNAGYVTIESANQAGEIAARQIVSIVNDWRKYEATQGRLGFPDTFGIRWPNDSKNDPYFRAFTLGDTAYRDQNFIKVDEESLEDLFADRDEVETE